MYLTSIGPQRPPKDPLDPPKKVLWTFFRPFPTYFLLAKENIDNLAQKMYIQLWWDLVGYGGKGRLLIGIYSTKLVCFLALGHQTIIFKTHLCSLQYQNSTFSLFRQLFITSRPIYDNRIQKKFLLLGKA